MEAWKYQGTGMEAQKTKYHGTERLKKHDKVMDRRQITKDSSKT